MKIRRAYNSSARTEKAANTRRRILVSAKILFESEGFEYVTIEKIAKLAEVAVPTIYALFQSKSGILRALMDDTLPAELFDELVEDSIKEKSPDARLRISAKIARQIYDSEKAQMDVFRGASVLAPEFKNLEIEKEMRRYERQQVTIKAMVKEKSLAKGLKSINARDILWALTGRDMYRMLVVEQGWTSDEYEEWLAKTLICSLMNSNF